MKIFVKAKPGSGEDKIEKIDETHFVISVKEPPVQGMANRAIIKLLANYFKIDIARVRIVSGAIARNKIVEILGI
ncbi:MAG: DUF167 domain-containing protein [Patescibacteria group bacterium]